MILSGLSPSSRIWIFQADRVLQDEEEQDLNGRLKDFVAGWKAHGIELMADAEILHSSIVVVGVDESKEPPSGCSIDKVFTLLKAWGASSGVDFFNRLLLNISYCNSAKILSKEQIQSSIESKELSAETLVFNSLATSLLELRNRTYLGLSESWMAPKLIFT